MVKLLRSINNLESIVSSNILGLDIGHSSIKFVELKRTFEGSPKVVNFGLEVFDSKGNNPEDALITKKIRELKEKYHIRAKDAVIYTSLIPTFTQLVTFPKLEKKKLKKEEAIWWQAKDFIPYELQDTILDFEILEKKTESNGSEKIEVVVSAVKKEEALRIAGLVEEAGLSPCGIKPWPLFMKAFFWENFLSLKNEEGICFIDFGSRITRVGFYHRGNFKLMREFGVGGCNITQALMTAVSSDRGEVRLEYSNALDLKFRHGLVLEESRDEKSPYDFAHLSVLMRPVIEKLLLEIKRSIELFQNKYPEVPVDKIFIFGGGSLLKGLPQLMKDELEKDVAFLDSPLPPSEFRRPQFAVSYALAIGRGRGLNLLPFKFKIARNIIYLQNAIRVLLISGFIFIFMFLVVSTSAVIYYRSAINERQAQMAALEPTISKLEKLISLKKEYEPYHALYNKLVASKPQVFYLLKEISLLAPQRVQLMSLDIKKLGEIFNLELQGVAFADGFNAQQVLADFIESLEKSVFFSDVKLISMTENAKYEIKAVNFKILCRLVTDY